MKPKMIIVIQKKVKTKSIMILFKREMNERQKLLLQEGCNVKLIKSDRKITFVKYIFKLTQLFLTINEF